MPADLRRRRLVLVGGLNEDAQVVNELRRERGEADTESLPSLDEGSVVSCDGETEMPTPECQSGWRFGMHSSPWMLSILDPRSTEALA